MAQITSAAGIFRSEGHSRTRSWSLAVYSRGSDEVGVLHVQPAVVDRECTTTQASGSHLRIGIEVTEKVAMLRASGDIDVVTALAFEHKILDLTEQHRTCTVLVDLLGVQFLSSAALAVLMRTAEDLEGRCRFLIVAEGPVTVRPLRLVGLSEALEIHPTVEAALSTV